MEYNVHDIWMIRSNRQAIIWHIYALRGLNELNPDD